MRHHISVLAVALIIVFAASSAAQIRNYESLIGLARTGATSFRVPQGSNLRESETTLANHRFASFSFSTSSDTFNDAVFVGDSELVSARVIATNDEVNGPPSISNSVSYTTGMGDSLWQFPVTGSTAPESIAYPDRSNGTVVSMDGYRQARFGEYLGRFRMADGGFRLGAFRPGILPSLDTFASDVLADPDRPSVEVYSRIHLPDAANSRLVAQVERVDSGAREIRVISRYQDLFVAADSPDLRFRTEEVAISSNGNHVAFHATDSTGLPGIYRWNRLTEALDLVVTNDSTGVAGIDPQTPGINGTGVITFRGIDAQGRSSVFVADGTDTQRLFGEGDLIPTDVGMRQLGRVDVADNVQIGAPQINDRGDVLALFDYFDPANPANQSEGEIAVLMPVELSTIDADFNDDGSLDCADIDALTADLVDGGVDVHTFDLNGDGSIDRFDLDQWLHEAGSLDGDANLDGVVDVGDFNVWNSNKFTLSPRWCAGDFNASGAVDVADFGVWNGNKFTVSDISTLVPEPSGLGFWFLIMIVRSWSNSARSARIATSQGCMKCIDFPGAAQNQKH